jgi:hypothetical protein
MQPGAGAAGLDVHGAQISFDHGEFTSGGFTTAPIRARRSTTTPSSRTSARRSTSTRRPASPATRRSARSRMVTGLLASSDRPTADLVRRSLDDERRRRRRRLRRPADERARHLQHDRDVPRDRHPGLLRVRAHDRGQRRRDHDARHRHHQRRRRRRVLLCGPEHRRDPAVQRHRLRVLQGNRSRAGKRLGGLPVRVARRRQRLRHGLRRSTRVLRHSRHSPLDGGRFPT